MMKVFLVILLLFLAGCRDIPVAGDSSVSDTSVISSDREYDDTSTASGQIVEIKKKGDQSLVNMVYADGEQGPAELYAYGDMVDGFQPGDVTDFEYLLVEMTSKNKHFQRFEIYSIRKSDTYYDSSMNLKDLINIEPVKIGIIAAGEEPAADIEDAEAIADFMEKLGNITVYDKTYTKTDEDPQAVTEITLTDAENNNIVLKENNSVIIETPEGSTEYYYGFMQGNPIRALAGEFFSPAAE